MRPADACGRRRPGAGTYGSEGRPRHGRLSSCRRPAPLDLGRLGGAESRRCSVPYLPHGDRGATVLALPLDFVPTEGAQMYASYLQVHFNSGKKSAAIQLLNDEIIPQVKQAPGFVKGIWVGNDELGHGVVVFEAREQAAQVTQAMQSVSDVYDIVTTGVYEVHGEA